MTSVLWLRRDLRLRDHPALHEAAADGPVVALFVLDPALLGPAGAPRVAFLYRTLRALDARLREHGGRLVVRLGDPLSVVPAVAAEAGAGSVHVSADFAPYGSARDERVERALGDVRLVRTGSPYAVAPGRVVKGDGEPFKVYSPFYRAWRRHGWRAPATDIVDQVHWAGPVDGVEIPAEPDLPPGLELPEPGEDAALAAWRSYRGRGSRPTARIATGRISTAPRTCRSTSSGGACTRARCSPISDRTTRPTARSSRGGSSTPACCSTGPTALASTTSHGSPRWRTRAPTRRRSTRGGRGAPDTPSSMRACASCSLRAGCTTGCA